MELIFPWVIYIGIPVVLILPFLNRKRKEKYEEGQKVTNTGFIEETPYYKKLLKKYKFYCAISMSSLLIAVAVCFALLARPSKVETQNPEIHNRDIMLCMDTSDSVDELNANIIEELKGVVKKLDGERFGITIFNGKAVLLVPLTNDYDYVLEILDKLGESIEHSLLRVDEDLDYDDYDLSVYYYKHNGTLSDYGSSFIGDGLASGLYNFPDLKENKERSRMIIFTTDNELNGTPFVTLSEATALCKKNDVKVFAVTPDNVVDEQEFQSAIESTDGKFYKATGKQTFEELVEDIEKTETSVMEEVKTTYVEQPQILFVCLLIFIGIHFLFSRKVKL